MIKTVIVMFCLLLLPVSVSAEENTLPGIDDIGTDRAQVSPYDFLEEFWGLIENTMIESRPDLRYAAQVSSSVLAAGMVLALLTNLWKGPAVSVDIVTTAVITAILFQGTNSMLVLAKDTVLQMSQYGKLLLPVMTGALAAQGGISSSAGLYIGTTLFDAILGGLLTNLYVPLVYVYLALAVARSAVGMDILKKLRDLVKAFLTWSLKIILTVYTTYMSITGVVSGTTDAAALKATKVTISTMVPVIGGILSDASEAVLVGAGVMKNAAGIYGLLAIIGMVLGPFLKIGIHFLLLKLTAALCGVLGTQTAASLTEDYSSSMGMMLAITGAMCLLLLISIVCFMKGVG